MPAVSAQQQKLMGSDLNRARHGQKTRTGMKVSQLEEFAHKPKQGFAGVKRKG